MSTDTTIHGPEALEHALAAPSDSCNDWRDGAPVTDQPCPDRECDEGSIYVHLPGGQSYTYTCVVCGGDGLAPPWQIGV